MKNVLVISRRRHFKIRDKFIKEIFPHDNIIHCSDEKNVAPKELNAIWWKDFWVKNNDSLEPFGEKYEEIISRCRFLRELDFKKSKNLIDDSLSTWENLLITNKIEVVYCLPIDSYVLHSLYLVCKKNKIKFFSTIGTFFKQRIRLSNFGEVVNNDFSQNAALEVNKFIEDVKVNSIQPDWLIGTSESVYKIIIKRLFIDLLKPSAFYIYRNLNKDYDSFSFPKFFLYKKRMFSTPERALISIRIEREALSPIEVKKGYVFIPLQFYPEVTSDYWNNDLNLINHHEVVLNVLKAIPIEREIILKEHPASISRRDAKFLKKLIKFQNVRFAKTQSSMNEWLKNAGLIIGNASTTTINALILNKPVIFFTKPYFDIDFPAYFQEQNFIHMSAVIDKYKNFRYSEDQIFKLIMQLYNGSARGSLGQYVPIGENNKSSKIEVSSEFKSYLFSYLKIS